MTDQAITPADAGGNAGAGDTSQSTNDNGGFVDLDAVAAAQPDNGPAADDNGIIDWDAQPAANSGEGAGGGEGEGDNADAKKAGEGEGEEPKPDAENEEAKKRLSGAQRAKQQRNQLLDQIAERDREIARLKAAQAPAEKAGDAPQPPKEEDFNGDWFAYQNALAAFNASEAAKKATNEVLKANEESKRTERATIEAQERLDAHLDRVEVARGVITDFDKVMEGMKGVEVRNDVINEIMSSEKSALVAYHFAQNPKELEALNSKSATEIAREIGRLEERLRAPEPKKQTTAPAPLSKPKGGANPAPTQEARLNAFLDKTYGKDRRK